MGLKDGWEEAVQTASGKENGTVASWATRQPPGNGHHLSGLLRNCMCAERMTTSRRQPAIKRPALLPQHEISESKDKHALGDTKVRSSPRPTETWQDGMGVRGARERPKGK